MSVILHLETATAVCSVALARDGQLLGYKVLREGFRHAENLMVLVDELLREQGISFKELNAVAVSNGPGSYTGLRIGLSTAKGLAYALSIPLITLSTLEIMTKGFKAHFPEFTGCIIPMMDARRMEVYTAVFSNKGERLSKDFPLILDDQSYREFSEQNMAFFGDGAAKYRAVCPYSTAVFDFDPDWHAAHMVELAYSKFIHNEFADLAYCEPDYLKPFFTTAKPVSE